MSARRDSSRDVFRRPRRVLLFERGLTTLILLLLVLLVVRLARWS